jgi:diacylglycerol kinase
MFEFINGFRFAVNGILDAIIRERNFRLQWLMGTMVLVLMNALSLELWQEIALLVLVFLVLAFELHNCAIEKTCDSIGKDHDLDKKRAKDFAAACVLLMSIVAVCVFFLIISEEQEAIVFSFTKNKKAFWAWGAAFMCSLPMTLKISGNLVVFMLFIVGIFMYVAFIVFSQNLTIYLFIGTAFLAVTMIAYGKHFLGITK